MKELVAILALALAGCASPRNDWVDLESPPDGGPPVKWYDMTAESGLYRDPRAPSRCSAAEAADYIAGFRLGWKDEAEDIRWSVDSYGNVSAWHEPACSDTRGESPIFMNGYGDGCRQAEKDRKVFDAKIRKDIKAQNQPSEGTR
jgi:hypothetical protein